ncbi:hypothetical protein L7F22_042877 [Adiantum nelumboides]|nr:hypothetical protein [Adiantum nelumboides]
MADNNKENRMSIDDFYFAHEDATDDTSMLVNYLVTRLHQAMGSPALQGKVQQQLHAYGILPPPQQERDPEKSHGETSKRGLSMAREVENLYQELKQLLEGKPSSKKKGHAQHGSSLSREREESESQEESKDNVAPRRRRAQRSPTPTNQKRSPHSPHHRESKREKKSSRKKKERKRSPSSPSSSPSSSFDKDKVLAFIQQFDAAFGDEGFTESSKLRHVAMHFQKSSRQWWASLQDNKEVPKTWKALRASIMKKLLASDAKDKCDMEWEEDPHQREQQQEQPHQPKETTYGNLTSLLLKDNHVDDDGEQVFMEAYIPEPLNGSANIMNGEGTSICTESDYDEMEMEDDMDVLEAQGSSHKAKTQGGYMRETLLCTYEKENLLELETANPKLTVHCLFPCAIIIGQKFYLCVKDAPASVLLLKAAGKVTVDQARAIANEKLPDLNCSTIESAMRIIAGTAANMGIDIDPPLLKKKERVVF